MTVLPVRPKGSTNPIKTNPRIGTSVLSIVLATLAKNHRMQQTLDCIARINLSVETILVVPEMSITRLENFSFPERTRILISELQGQVWQRQHGLTHAKGDYILQLDDDMEFDPLSVTTLIQAIDQMPDGAYLAPVILPIDKVKQCSYSNATGLFDFGGLPKRLPGYDKTKNTPTETSWLPGGFVICKKTSVYVPQQYPFSGKAFDEDVLQSVLRTKAGNRHFILQNIFVQTDISEDDDLPIFYDFQIKKFIRRISDINWLLFILSYGLRVMKRIIRKFEKYRAIKDYF